MKMAALLAEKDNARFFKVKKKNLNFIYALLAEKDNRALFLKKRFFKVGQRLIQSKETYYSVKRDLLQCQESTDCFSACVH